VVKRYRISPQPYEEEMEKMDVLKEVKVVIDLIEYIRISMKKKEEEEKHNEEIKVIVKENIIPRDISIKIG
jgi:hypothetical protein